MAWGDKSIMTVVSSNYEYGALQQSMVHRASKINANQRRYFRALIAFWNFNLVARQLPSTPFGAVELAEAILSFVRVAGVWIGLVLVQPVVPFGADRLVICRPRFRA
jgi:hypothetical protein